jgi:hypothetical protein
LDQPLPRVSPPASGVQGWRKADPRVCQQLLLDLVDRTCSSASFEVGRLVSVRRGRSGRGLLEKGAPASVFRGVSGRSAKANPTLAQPAQNANSSATSLPKWQSSRRRDGVGSVAKRSRDDARDEASFLPRPPASVFRGVSGRSAKANPTLAQPAQNANSSATSSCYRRAI